MFIWGTYVEPDNGPQPQRAAWYGKLSCAFVRETVFPGPQLAGQTDEGTKAGSLIQKPLCLFRSDTLPAFTLQRYQDKKEVPVGGPYHILPPLKNTWWPSVGKPLPLSWASPAGTRESLSDPWHTKQVKHTHMLKIKMSLEDQPSKVGQDLCSEPK